MRELYGTEEVQSADCPRGSYSDRGSYRHRRKLEWGKMHRRLSTKQMCVVSKPIGWYYVEGEFLTLLESK